MCQMTRDIFYATPHIGIKHVLRVMYFHAVFLFIIGTTAATFMVAFALKVRRELLQFRDVDKSRKDVIERVSIQRHFRS